MPPHVSDAPGPAGRLELPSDSAAYKSYALVKDKFGEGMSAPLVAVAHTPANMSEEQAQQAQIDIASAVKERGGANVQAVVPGGMTDDRTLMIFQVIPAYSASSVETEELVHELRSVTVPVQGSKVSLGIAGQTSGNIDVSEVLAQKLPLYLGVVMGLSFLVLILVFRSIMVPLVASVGFPLLGAGELRCRGVDLPVGLHELPSSGLTTRVRCCPSCRPCSSVFFSVLPWITRCSW